MHNWNYTMQLEINLTTDWITIKHPQTIFLTFTNEIIFLYTLYLTSQSTKLILFYLVIAIISS